MTGKLLDKARLEASALPRPNESLAAFSTLHVEPMLQSNEVKNDKKRSKMVTMFEGRLGAELEKAKAAWNGRGGAGDRRLVLKPILLRFTWGGNMASFLGAPYAGSPQISLALQFVDGTDGRIIASPIITETELAVFGIEAFDSKGDELTAFVAAVAGEYLMNRMADAPVAQAETPVPTTSQP